MGRRSVATGGAARRQSRLPRNPWKASILDSPRRRDGAENFEATACNDDSAAPAGAELGGERVHGLRSSTRSTRGYIPRPLPGPMIFTMESAVKKLRFKTRKQGILRESR
jgi:hypothetical protein